MKGSSICHGLAVLKSAWPKRSPLFLDFRGQDPLLAADCLSALTTKKQLALLFSWPLPSSVRRRLSNAAFSVAHPLIPSRADLCRRISRGRRRISFRQIPLEIFQDKDPDALRYILRSCRARMRRVLLVCMNQIMLHVFPYRI